MFQESRVSESIISFRTNYDFNGGFLALVEPDRRLVIDLEKKAGKSFHLLTLKPIHLNHVFVLLDLV